MTHFNEFTQPSMQLQSQVRNLHRDDRLLCRRFLFTGDCTEENYYKMQYKAVFTLGSGYDAYWRP